MSQTVLVHGTVLLECEASGVPPPTVMWFLNDTMVWMGGGRRERERGREGEREGEGERWREVRRDMEGGHVRETETERERGVGKII